MHRQKLVMQASRAPRIGPLSISRDRLGFTAGAGRESLKERQVGVIYQSQETDGAVAHGEVGTAGMAAAESADAVIRGLLGGNATLADIEIDRHRSAEQVILT